MWTKLKLMWRILRGKSVIYRAKFSASPTVISGPPSGISCVQCEFYTSPAVLSEPHNFAVSEVGCEFYDNTGSDLKVRD